MTPRTITSRPGSRQPRCQELLLVSIVIGLLAGVAYTMHRSRAGVLNEISFVSEKMQKAAAAEAKLKKELEKAKADLKSCNDALSRERRERENAAAAAAAANTRSDNKENGKPSLNPKAALEADALTLRALLKKQNASMQEEWQTMLDSQPPMGILVVAGAQKYLLNAFVSLWAVRRHWNSTLPIALMYWGESESINDATREFFYKELGEPTVQFIDASKDIPWPPHHRALFPPDQNSERMGWVLKLAAAYLAPFQQVFYIDADSAPLVAPESLFKLPDYRITGTMFWPDTPCQRPGLFTDLIALGLIAEEDAPAVDEHETESGQWLLDRRKHREALEYIMLLGTHANYGFSRAFGDKDLFRAGFALAGHAADYTLVPVSLGFAWGPPDPTKQSQSRLMRGYIQHSPAGQPLFHHRAGWETKYDLEHPNGRPLDAISSPLPCSWTMQHWPFEYPGAMDNTQLKMVDEEKCPYSLAVFGSAVGACAEDFLSGKGKKVPLFSIKGSAVEQVHVAQEEGWKRVIEARELDKTLFENR